MQETFEYFTTKRFESEIEVSDIGNWVIRANSDTPLFCYLWIKTELGMTKVAEISSIILDEFGFMSDATYLKKSFAFSYFILEYDEKKISKIIDKFLNKSNFTQAIEMTEEQFKEEVPSIDIFKFMKGEE